MNSDIRSASNFAIPRIPSIDIMRGIVILLMMLDHVRERFYMHTRTGDPIYDSIEPDLFFTRFITHFCAPIFIFLAGLSAWLYANPSTGPRRSASRFLFKRGLVIVAIEIVFYYLVWADSYPNFLFLQVLWAIGLCMIGLALVCNLNYWVVGALGLTITLGHNLLTPIDFAPGHWMYIPWTILHDAGDAGKIAGLTVSISYPALPWLGVILLGFFSGPLFAQTTDKKTRKKALLYIGLSCLLLLLILRGFNIYGETLPWAPTDSFVGSVMSFLNYTKYPPSLDYLLVTLGIGLIVLAWIDSFSQLNKGLETLRVFGSVPMFVYLIHLYALLAAYWLLYLVFGATHDQRFGLPSVMWIWLGAFLLITFMYPIASAFSKYKHKHEKVWLSYL